MIFLSNLANLNVKHLFFLFSVDLENVEFIYILIYFYKPIRIDR